LDHVGPARQHAEKINVARRPVRHAAPVPRQNRRAPIDIPDAGPREWCTADPGPPR
jgi:hypothetical protein